MTATAGTTIPVFLQGSDPNGDPLTYSATSQNLDRSLQNTYNFFQENGTYYTNARGQNEKYLKSPVSFTGQPIQPSRRTGTTTSSSPTATSTSTPTRTPATRRPQSAQPRGEHGDGRLQQPDAAHERVVRQPGLGVSGNQLRSRCPPGCLPVPSSWSRPPSATASQHRQPDLQGLRDRRVEPAADARAVPDQTMSTYPVTRVSPSRLPIPRMTR